MYFNGLIIGYEAGSGDASGRTEGGEDYLEPLS